MVHVCFGLQILGGVMVLALGGAGFYFGMCIDIPMHIPFGCYDAIARSSSFFSFAFSSFKL